MCKESKHAVASIPSILWWNRDCSNPFYLHMPIMEKLIQWLRKTYHLSIHSFGIYPGLLTILFLLFFILTYSQETSSPALLLKRTFVWMNLKNTDAARTIITTVATGIIGLMVFSFSMVMVVMGQAASQMSNRILDNLIGNKLQQTTLGFYLGTIVSSFFLLSVVDDKGTTFIPSLSVFFLVVLTIADLFMFVSFLQYITKSVRFEQLIKTIHQKTRISLAQFYAGHPVHSWTLYHEQSLEVAVPASGYFQGINRKQLLTYLMEHNLQLEVYPFRCTYVVTGEPFLKLYFNHRPSQKVLEQIFSYFDFYTGQEIDKNPYYGFLHLSEVAIKALSPGINDPGTAVLCIHALTDLLIQKLQEHSTEVFTDKNETPRVYIKERGFDEVFRFCLFSIWDYGKKDRFVQHACQQMVQQLTRADTMKVHSNLFHEFKTMIKSS